MASTIRAILFKDKDEPWFRLGGMTLYERNLRYLERLGISKATLVIAEGDELPEIEVPRPLNLAASIETVFIGGAEISEPLHKLDDPPDEPALMVNANTLVDVRLFSAMLEQTPPVFLVDDHCHAEDSSWSIGYLSQSWATMGNTPWQDSPKLNLSEVDTYAPELRGFVEPYFLRITEQGDLEAAWNRLIDRAQKRQGDFIEKYAHPEPQNWMVKKICDSSITPNQISIAVVIVAVLAAILFFQGAYFTAYFVAFAATVLDGVDGKLARVKMMTSKLGELEHVFDYFYENAWYLALASQLSVTQGATAWLLGGTVTICDTLDKSLGAAFQKRAGKTLDEMSPFDNAFRLIGGRRSIYLFILLVAFCFQAPFAGLAAVMGWAVITLLTHSVSAFTHLLRAAA